MKRLMLLLILLSPLSLFSSPHSLMKPKGTAQDMLVGLTPAPKEMDAPRNTAIEVVFDTPLEYGVVFGEITGNTASYGSIAWIDVALKTKPEDNVTFEIHSDDPTEGVAYNYHNRRSNKVVITPENWKYGQAIEVRGQNRNTIDGKQNYKIITSLIVSNDPNYDGIDPDDIEMKGEYLEIDDPDDRLLFIAGVEKHISMGVKYNGFRDLFLKYSLLESPEGMTLYISKLLWTPAKKDIGKTYPVKLKVTDGYRSAEKSFEVRVAEPYVLKQKVEGHTITITEKNSTLNGVTIEVMDKSIDISGLMVMALNDKDMKQLPKMSQDRISEVFMLNKFLPTKMRLWIPVVNIPNNKDQRSVDIKLLENTDDYEIEILEGGSMHNEMWVGFIPFRKFKKHLDEDMIEFPFGGGRPYYIYAREK